MPDETQTTPPPGDDEAAKAAAAATAKAETEKAAAEKQAPQKVKPAPAVDRDLIARLAADVADNIGVRQEHFDALAERLRKSHGLKLRHTSEGRIYARMAGIEGGSRTSEREALINWGNAARRALNHLAA